MSHNDFIGKMLDLKDPNIVFDQNCYTEEIIKGITYKVFHATLSYKPVACSNCATLFDHDIIKHGFKNTCIKLPTVVGNPTLLRLKKQRYLCRHCNSTFTLFTPDVAKNCFISRNSKFHIALCAKKKLSEKDIAELNNVSHSTVSRIIDNAYVDYKAKRNFLPEHLCFDEFKSVKAASGAMSFIYCDATNGQIIDIVENRRLNYLKTYFYSFTKTARASVKTVVIDIYTPYIQLIKSLFPNAEIIFDRFHIVQQFHRALNSTRIKLMKAKDKHYKKLKNHWKLLLKAAHKLDRTRLRYNRHFRRQMLETDIVEALLEINPVLKDTYELYQSAITAIRLRNCKMFWNAIEHPPENISDQMAKTIRTMKKHREAVTNALKYDFSNGVLEGINNKIKTLKRIAFGYRCFVHFKNRILITQEMVVLKTG